jgi:hypothetical protein
MQFSLLTEKDSNAINKIPSLLVSGQLANGYDLSSIVDYVRKNGGTVLGKGSWGIVLSHPNWKFVLKIFKDDVPYLKYVRLCIKYPRPSFPVFYDLPRKIKPTSGLKINDSKEILYAVKMEKLEEINEKEFLIINSHIENAMYVRRMGRDYKNQVADVDRKDPKLKQLKEDFLFLLNKIRGKYEFGELDLHQGNFMKRSNGEYVLSDPLMSRNGIANSDF